MSLSVSFRKALSGLTLDMAFDAPAGVTALYGPSGCGKTSTANAVAGLLRPDAGRITVGGRVLFGPGTDLPPHRRRIGYVFQDARLFPHLDVAGNLDYGARFAARPDAAARDRVIAMLGLGALLNRRPAGLSGGEAQRVAIGRALLSGPELLIMDEPLAALDPARKAEILPYLLRLRAEGGLPILYVSHAMAEIAQLADTLIAMSAGRVTIAAPLADALSDPEAARLIGPREAGAMLDVCVAGQADDELTRLDTPAGPFLVPHLNISPGNRMRLRIHAHEVMLSRDRPTGLSALNILPAQVLALATAQDRSLVQLQVGKTRLLAAVTERSARAMALAPGANCHAIIKTVALIR